MMNKISIFLLAFCFSLISSGKLLAAKGCPIRAVSESEFGVFSGDKQITEGSDVERFIFDHFTKLVTAGTCNTPTPQTCSVRPAKGNKQQHAVYINGDEQISMAWYHKEYAIEAYQTLQKMKICKPPILQECRLKSVGDKKLAVFTKDDERISRAWYNETYAFESYLSLQRKGACKPPTPQECRLKSVGDKMLAVYTKDDERISRAWRIEEYAFEAYQTLQKMNVCKPPTPQECRLKSVGDQKLAVYTSDDERISEVCGGEEYAVEAYQTLQKMGICKPPTPQICSVKPERGGRYAVYTTDSYGEQRISWAWNNWTYAVESLQFLQRMRVCEYHSKVGELQDSGPVEATHPLVERRPKEQDDSLGGMKEYVHLSPGKTITQ